MAARRRVEETAGIPRIAPLLVSQLKFKFAMPSCQTKLVGTLLKRKPSIFLSTNLFESRVSVSVPEVLWDYSPESVLSPQQTLTRNPEPAGTGDGISDSIPRRLRF